MTNEEAVAMLNLIRENADDPDRAHALEDKLRTRVLEAIMRGEGDPVALSVIALMSKDIEFSRWTG
jgi:hypothetical protein